MFALCYPILGLAIILSWDRTLHVPKGNSLEPPVFRTLTTKVQDFGFQLSMIVMGELGSSMRTFIRNR